MTGITRRGFLRSAAAVGAALALPLVPALPTPRVLAAEEPSAEERLAPEPIVLRPMGPPGFQPWWVVTFLPTKLWPNADEMAEPVEAIGVDRYFRVEGPQEGYRVPVWDARENRIVYIGVEAIGPVGTPTWADYSDD